MTILSALILSSCASRIVHGSGKVVAETRQVRRFSRVDVCCGMELYLEQSNRESLEIEAEDNILAEIESIVQGDILVIKFRGSYPDVVYSPKRSIQIYLTVNEIEGIEISGGGELFAEDISTNSLVIDLSGGSDAEIDFLKADYFDLNVSGGGDIELVGEVTKQFVDASGGSSYQAKELHSEEATLNISGGGSAMVWVDEIFNVDASGGSSVRYFGTPRIQSDVSGGSEITGLGEP